MALETQDITVDFGQGLEQKTDSKRIPVGSLTVANNIMFTKDKQVRRRYGLTELSTAAASTDMHPSTTLPATTGSDVYENINGVYEKVTTGQVTNTRFASDFTTASIKNVETVPSTRSTQACYSNSDFVLTCAVDLSSGYRLIANVAKPDGTVVRSQVLATGGSPNEIDRIVIKGSSNTAYIFYSIASGTTIQYISYDLAAGTFSATVSIATRLASTAAFWDVQQDGSVFYLAHYVTALQLRVTQRTFATPGTAVWTVNHVTTAAGPLCFNQPDTTPTQVEVFAKDGTNVRYCLCTTAGATATTGTYVAITATTTTELAANYQVATSKTTLALAGQGPGLVSKFNNEPDHRIYFYGASSLTSGGTVKSVIGHCLLTGFYRQGNNLYCITQNRTLRGLLLITDITASPPQTVMSLGVDLPPVANIDTSNVAFPIASNVQSGSTTSAVFPLTRIQTSATSAGTGSLSFVSHSVKDIGFVVFSTAATEKAALDGKSYFSKGRVVDLTGSPILDPPRIVDYSTSGGTANTTSLVCVSRLQRNGVTYRSPLSNVVNVTGSFTYTLTVFPSVVAADQGTHYVDLYATEDLGSVFYYYASYQVPYALNTAGVTLYFTMEFVEASQEQLYAQGGAFENIPPAAPRWVCSAKNRLWVPSPENNTDLFHSSQPITGEDVRWHPDLVVKVPAQGGEITAVIEHNQRVLVFKENAVYAVSGDGPGLTGQGGSFQVDQLTTSYGCEGPSAIQLIPGGVIFKSADKGFWLVTDRYEFEYIGRGVDTYKATSILTSVHVPAQNQVRFLLPTDTDGSASVFLVYDYYYKQWFIHRVTLSSSGPFEKVVDSCVSGDGRLYFLTDATTPRVLYEDSANYVDGSVTNTSTAYRPTLTTGWINFADVDGYQRIRYFDIQGTNTSAGGFTFNVTVYYNYDDVSGPDYFTFAMTAGNTNATNKLIRRIFLSDGKQKSRAIKVEITAASGSAEAFAETTLTSLTFRLGIKKKAAPADESSRS